MKERIDEPFLLEQEAGTAEPSAPGSDVPTPHLVSASSSLWIVLPHQPTSPTEAAAMIEERVPLRAGDLAWTDPMTDENGELGLSVIRKASLDLLDYPAEAIDERTGLAFANTLRFVDRRTSVTGSTVGLAALVAILAIATIPDAPTRTAPTDDFAASSQLVSTIEQRPVAPTIALASQLVQRGFDIRGVAADETGNLTLDVDTPDPDVLRSRSSGDTGLAGFQSTSQTRVGEGSYRVSFEGKLAAPVGEPVTIAPLVAQSHAAASASVENYLQRLAARHAIQLTLSHARPDGSEPLRFSLGLEGPEKDVLAVVQAIEKGRQPLVLASWSYLPAASGAVFSASLIVPWSARP